MTAPTQPPDPRVQRIADAAKEWGDGFGTASHQAFARVLVEELGGREGETPPDVRAGDWYDIFVAIDRAGVVWRPSDRTATSRDFCDAIRTLAQRATDAEKDRDGYREELSMASACVDSLRAELDAIKGAQVPYRWTVVSEDRMSFTFTSLGSAQTWANGEGGEVIPLYRHPAPALPVVGACVVEDGKPLVTYTNTVFGTQADKEAVAMDVAKSMGATAHIVHLGAPLPTEGGK